jgi:hypothetical protein
MWHFAPEFHGFVTFSDKIISNNGGLDEADFGQAVSVRAVSQPCSVHHP